MLKRFSLRTLALVAQWASLSAFVVAWGFFVFNISHAVLIEKVEKEMILQTLFSETNILLLIVATCGYMLYVPASFLKGCTGHNVFVWSIEATMLVVCFVFIGDVRISNETIMNAVLLVTKYSFVLYACYILGGLFIGTSFLRRTT